jgi:aquaporin Z
LEEEQLLSKEEQLPLEEELLLSEADADSEPASLPARSGAPSTALRLAPGSPEAGPGNRPAGRATMSIGRKAIAELLGTFWLVFASVGSAVIAGNKIGNLGVALAFGLSVLTMAYAIGHISGAHVNPAVTVGLAAAGRFPRKDVLPYVLAQLIGGFIGAGVLLMVAQSAPGGYSAAESGLGANGFGEHSPAGYSAAGAFLTEVVMTFIFLMVILGATSKRGINGFAGLAIGLCLTLIHLVDIPITNCSINPARSTGPALFVGGWAMAQLWMFWVAPLLGALLAGMAARALEPDQILGRGAPRIGPPGPEERVGDALGPRAPTHARG